MDNGRRFTIVTDHASLKYLQTQNSLSKRQARWIETLQSYDFDIQYKPGPTNIVADALSRRRSTTEVAMAAISVATSDADRMLRIRRGYQDDVYFKEVLQEIESGKTVAGFVLEDALLYKTDVGAERHLCVPRIPEILSEIMQELHDEPLAGHFGYHKTYEAAKKRYYWPRMWREVRRYIQSCDKCLRNKPLAKNQGLLQPLPIPERRWDQVTMDLITNLPRTLSGMDAIFVIVDKLSKRAHFLATSMHATAEELARLFFSEVVRHHGIPRSIVSDRDPRFTAEFWQTLWKLAGTRTSLSTAFHPQTDGQTERMNRTLEQYLRIYVDYDQNTWDSLLAAAEFAYNNASQASTGFTPFELDCGQVPLLPSDIALGSPISSRGGEDAAAVGNKNAADTLKRWETSIKKAKETLAEAQKTQKHYADAKRKEVIFKVNDKVLLSTRNYISDVDRQRPSRKLSARFYGPFPVEKVISQTAYRLSLPKSMRIHPVFHVSQLKRYDEEGEIPHHDNDTGPPEPVAIEGNMEYEVEKILDKRQRYGKTQYLVRWKGYTIDESTWEPAEFLGNSQELIQEYELNKEIGH